MPTRRWWRGPQTVARVVAAVVALALGGSVAGAAVPPPLPARGGTLRVGIGGNWGTMDPAQSTSVAERQLFHSLYTPLLTLDPSFVIGPGLVKSWTISSTGARVTFHLQPGVRFQDGTTFDAAAVKFNIDRILDPATGSAYRTALAPIAAVRVVNPATVQVDLNGAFTPLLAWFTDSPGFMASPTAVRKWGGQYTLHPVGTGPFGFVEWVKNDHITLKRYDAYWEKGLPYLDGLVYRPIPDDTVQVADLRAGVLDVIDTVPADQQRSIRADDRFHSVRLAAARWPMIRLNVTIPPFDNTALRQALSYALNRDQIVGVTYSGQARPAYGPISPVYRGYFDPSIGQWGISTNPDKARAKLAEGGQPQGFAFTLDISTSQDAARLAQMIKTQGQAVGIAITVQADDPAALRNRIARKGFEAVLGAAGLRPDIDGTMDSFFSTDGAANWGSYSDSTVDALFDQARVTADGPDRVAFYRQIQRQVVVDAPWVFLVFENLMVGMDRRIQGLPDIPDTLLRFRTAWLQR